MTAITPIEGGSTSFLSSLALFFVPTAHAEEAQDDEGEEGGDEKEGGGGEEGGEENEEGGADEEGGSGGDEEEEEDEPVDPAPAIRKECEETQCSEPAKHFKHCAERVEGGHGFQHEDCVEELFHMMHCVDSCSAPKLFKRLV